VLKIAGSYLVFCKQVRQEIGRKKLKRQAARALAQAKQNLEVNYMEGLSIAKEPYELEREALIKQVLQQ